MKKFSNILSSFLLSIAFLAVIGSTFPVFAQTPDEKKLADFIEQRTVRSFAGLTERRTNRGISVDLEGRFQNLMLARLDYSGNPVAGCVTDLPEASLFFGKDLESGQPLFGFQSPLDELSREADRHGMSVEELLFYKTLIQQAADQIAQSPNTATITIVNNDAAGEGFNDPTAVVARRRKHRHNARSAAA